MKHISVTDMPVIFRVFEGEVTAIFPTEPGTNNPDCCTCYAHVGQHGTCSKGWYPTTLPATPDDYKDLLAELQEIYSDVGLKVVKKWTARHDIERYNKLKK